MMSTTSCAGFATIVPGTRRVYNVKQFDHLPITEGRTYSEHGEDGVIASIFSTIGTTNRFFVEIGCGDGTECNTRRLAEIAEWDGFKLDCAHSDAERRVYQETVTPGEVRRLLHTYGCPQAPDLLSIDIDSNDWHVLHAILQHYQPVLIVAEYNANLGFLVDATVPLYHAKWDGSRYFGASYAAFNRLGNLFNYRTVYVEASGTNMFMLRRDCCPQEVLDAERCFWLPGPMHGADPLHRPWHRSSEYLWD